jgi:peptidoglycan hydrolase-like protein with peptidoglycan-binding domain
MKFATNSTMTNAYMFLASLMLASIGTSFAGSNFSCDLKGAQVALRSHDIDVGFADGIWGAKTSNGVKKFQATKGIPETGTLDGPTCDALGIKKSCKAVLKEWTTHDMDKIAASWGTSRETAKRIGLKAPAVVSPKGCYLHVKGTKVTPYCNGKALTHDSCDNPYGVKPFM